MITFKKFILNEGFDKSLRDIWPITFSTFGKKQEDVAQLIRRDCWPFLNAIKDPSKNILWRGIRFNSHDNIVFERPVHKNRSPKDTPPQAQFKIDDYFEDNFGVRFRRRSVFAATKKNKAQFFGDEVCVMFPVGKFNSLFSPEIQDLTEDLIDLASETPEVANNPGSGINTMYDINLEKLPGMLDEFHWKFNTDLDTLHKYPNSIEVMIDCDSYYGIVIDSGYINIYDFLKGLK